MGNVIKEIAPLLHETTYEYDDIYRLTTVTVRENRPQSQIILSNDAFDEAYILLRFKALKSFSRSFRSGEYLGRNTI